MMTDGCGIFIPDAELMNGLTYCGYISDFKISGTGLMANPVQVVMKQLIAG